jgi:diguanylate cyclase (GGDEF)-like protein/PAS domain S-box-containing protein
MVKTAAWAARNPLPTCLGGLFAYLLVFYLAYPLLHGAAIIFALLLVLLMARSGGRTWGIAASGWVLLADLGLSFLLKDPEFTPFSPVFIVYHLMFVLAAVLVGASGRRHRSADPVVNLNGLKQPSRFGFSDPHIAAVIDQASVAVVVTDLEGDIVYVNPFFESVTGYTAEEAIGKNPRLMKSGHQSREFYRDLWAQITSGKTWKGVFINRKKDGSLFHEEATIFPIKDGSGEIINYAAVKQNITARVEAERASQEIELRYQALFDRSTDAVVIIGLDQKILAVNQQAVDLLGYQAEEIVSLYVTDLVIEDEREDADQKARWILEGEIPALYERRFVHKDGSIVIGEISAVEVFDPEGNPVYVQSVVRDITEKKRVERALRESEYRYRSLFNQTNDAVLLISQDGVVLDVNHRAAEMHGYDRVELIGMPVRLLSVEEERPAAEQVHNRLLSGEHLPVYERTARRKDGTTFPLEINIAVVKDQDGNMLYLQSISRDISHRKQLEEKLRYAALHDPLTGLPNRALFHDRLEHAMEKAKRNGQKAALLFIDLDNFKTVNDSFGHALGDQFLVQFVERIKSDLRKMDTFARLGGDEFGLLIEEVNSQEDVARVAEKMLANSVDPFITDGHQVNMNVSIGICIYPDNAGEIKTLMQYADEAMYRAKDHGKNNYRFYAQKS